MCNFHLSGLICSIQNWTFSTEKFKKKNGWLQNQFSEKKIQQQQKKLQLHTSTQFVCTAQTQRL